MEKKMSLEESMKDLAESNRERAAADRELAKAMTFYAETINKFGLSLHNSNEGKEPQPGAVASATSDKPSGRGRKPAATAKEEPAAAGSNDGFGDDGFGGEGGEGGGKEYTFDEVKGKLLELMKKNGGDKTESVAIINKYGYASLNDIKDAHFSDIYDAVEKALKTKK
jgi:hypothetical protein